MNNENEEVFEELSEREQLETIIADATEKLEKLEEREHLEATIEEASKRLEELTERESLDVSGGCLSRRIDKMTKVRFSCPVGRWIDLSNYIQPQGERFPWDLILVPSDHIKHRFLMNGCKIKRNSKNRV